MSNLTNYFSDIAKVLGISKEEIYDVVIGLMAAGTTDEDIEEAFKMMVRDDKEDTSSPFRSRDTSITKIALV